jgi:hypothetical protein
MGEHALLSASTAHRWVKCTKAPRLEETLPETRSEYADKGLLAHAIAELRLRKQYTDPMGQKAFNEKLDELRKDPLFSAEMMGHVDTYFDYIANLVYSFPSQPYVAIEKRLDYSEYAPEGFGTGDCIIISGTDLYVIDFKYGEGVPVSAYNNPQMKLYALGAYSESSFLFNIEKVTMVIVQPRIENISESTISIDELLAWGESTKPIAQKAYNGEGEFVIGEHCRFCRAEALCRARAEFNTSIEQRPIELLSDEEAGQLLARAQDLKAWVADLEEYVFSAILGGKDIPGWKVVEGRSTRQFTNVDDAFNVLKQNGIDEAMLYERKPITLTNVEKLLGKAKFNELLKEYVTKSEGKPTLVPESDKREPLKRPTAQDDFGN